jgi:hypothetical protein
MAKVANAYENRAICMKPSIAVIFVVCLVILIWGKTMHTTEILNIIKQKSYLNAVTWNMAAINNNPFEYWITTEMTEYNTMMKNVSAYIQNPEFQEVELGNIFTDEMFEELIKLIESESKLSLSIDSLRNVWQNRYRSRKSISGFLKDSVIGKKRLASMPDRLTNTITVSGPTPNDPTTILMRPTVINCYDGDISSIPKWWIQWRQFMFNITISTVDAHNVSQKMRVVDMLVPLHRSKYPAVTVEEEEMSLSLQLLCLALFDATLVHSLGLVAPNSWQFVRHTLCNKLNRNKSKRSLDILNTQYSDSSVIFLQEVGSSFLRTFQFSSMNDLYESIVPTDRDGDRDQNSVILLKRDSYTKINEVTSKINYFMDKLGKSTGSAAPVSKGDLLAITTTSLVNGNKYLFCSFHGDTNGLATIPVLAAVHKYAIDEVPDHILLFGMDANSYAKPEADQLGVQKLAEYYTSLGLNSCYGSNPDPALNITTCHARSYLQPQLNKVLYRIRCSVYVHYSYFWIIDHICTCIYICTGSGS